MYCSELDASPPELTIAFDPLRPLHAHDGSPLAWPEFPYKQVLIDRLCGKFRVPRLSVEAAAGALLIARGDGTRASFEVEQHFRDDEAQGEQADNCTGGWSALEARFRQERDAFRSAKRAFLASEKQKVAAKLQSIEQRHHDEAERAEFEAWRRRQIIKRYDNGSKYDGDGVNRDGVLIPHGQGTLWVPQKESLAGNDVKRVPRYVGAWMDGFMHGHGAYSWRNGDRWEGSFCRDEMQGKGVYTFGDGADGSDANQAIDSSRQSDAPRSKGQRVRFYDASQHVCWGDELVLGCRIRLFENRLYGDPLAAVVRRHNVDLEAETEYVIMRYDVVNDRYFVRQSESEATRWISLANSNFRVVAARPVTRLDADADAVD